MFCDTMNNEKVLLTEDNVDEAVDSGEIVFQSKKDVMSFCNSWIWSLPLFYNGKNVKMLCVASKNDKDGRYAVTTNIFEKRDEWLNLLSNKDYSDDEIQDFIKKKAKAMLKKMAKGSLKLVKGEMRIRKEYGKVYFIK